MKSIEDFKVGQAQRSRRRITDQDVRAFAELSGDKNPIHLDETYARSTRFGERVVHGAFLAACLSKVLGMELPGGASIYLSQELRFLKPVFVGDEIEVEVLIEALDADRRVVTLSNAIQNLSRNYRAAEGKSQIKLPKAL